MRINRAGEDGQSQIELLTCEILGFAFGFKRSACEGFAFEAKIRA